MANNPRYLVPLAKDEVESIIKFLRLFGGPPEDALLQRFERRLRQIASHEERPPTASHSLSDAFTGSRALRGAHERRTAHRGTHGPHRASLVSSEPHTRACHA
jgi:hypothetical protein